MAKYMDQSGAQHFAEALMSATKTINGQTIWGDGDIPAGSAKQPVFIEDFSKVWESTNLNTAAVGEIIPIAGNDLTKNLPTICESMPPSFSWAGYYVLLADGGIDSTGKNCLFVINTYLNSDIFNPANIYAYCFSTKDTTGGFDSSRWMAIPSAQEQVIDINYIAFHTAVINNNLIPGRMYKINDYKPVPQSGQAKQDPMSTPNNYTTSLFVRAISSNIYDENALLVDSNQSGIQEMYEVKYTVENKGFIDSARGHGTITYMRDFTTNNIAYWDWRPHYGIVAPDAEATTFTVCKNCHIAPYTINGVQKMVPYRLSHCNDVTIGRCSDSIYLQYVDDCAIGDFCTDVHLGVSLATRKVQHTVIGNNCTNIMILPSSRGPAVQNVIGSGCSSVQFAGSYNVIGNNCKNIYLSRYSGTAVEPSNYVSVGNNCSNIGRNSTFTTFDSLQVNYIGFTNVVIGDLCKNICVISGVTPTWTCTFNNCEFQKTIYMTLSAGTTSIGYTINDKVFRFVNTPDAHPLKIDAPNPMNWRILAGEISQDPSTYKFAFRGAIGSVWTNIQ